MTPRSFQKISFSECRHGLMCFPRSDGTIGRSLSLYGEFAEGENQVMGRYLRPGMTVIDVGANLGTTVLPMARAVGQGGKVIAFEPQPLMAQCLQTTLSLNELFNVRVISSAVGAQADWSKINAPDISAGGNYGAMSLGQEGLRVQVMKIDDLQLTSLHFMKIDVEGHEWPVIQGAQEVLLKYRPVIYLEAKRIPGTQHYLDWLMKNGWTCYWHFAFFYKSNNYKGNKENVFGGTGDMNILALSPGQTAPTDLPEVTSSDANWQNSYAQFYANKTIQMP
jgi:FkbM family methyltransferase